MHCELMFGKFKESDKKQTNLNWTNFNNGS